MSHSDHRTLINRGRKAGLNTSELYTALTTCPPERREVPGEADGNGFTVVLDARGQRRYQPSEDARAPRL
jgi:hypothetical protein